MPAEVAAELDALWKDVLLQQFHDILPGSSIAWVHADAEAAHARVAAAAGGDRSPTRSVALAPAGADRRQRGDARPRREVVDLSTGRARTVRCSSCRRAVGVPGRGRRLGLAPSAALARPIASSPPSTR